jgi:osmotically-inducible protein OsmY
MRLNKIFMGSMLVCAIITLMGCSAMTGTNVEYPVDDSTLARAVQDKITADAELSRLKIRVAAKQGEVTLTGIVPSRAIEARLIKLALSVQGVKSVKDGISVNKK